MLAVRWRWERRAVVVVVVDVFVAEATTAAPEGLSSSLPSDRLREQNKKRQRRRSQVTIACPGPSRAHRARLGRSSVGRRGGPRRPPRSRKRAIANRRRALSSFGSVAAQRQCSLEGRTCRCHCRRMRRRRMPHCAKLVIVSVAEDVSSMNAVAHGGYLDAPRPCGRSNRHPTRASPSPPWPFREGRRKPSRPPHRRGAAKSRRCTLRRIARRDPSSEKMVEEGRTGVSISRKCRPSIRSGSVPSLLHHPLHRRRRRRSRFFFLPGGRRIRIPRTCRTGSRFRSCGIRRARSSRIRTTRPGWRAARRRCNGRRIESKTSNNQEECACGRGKSVQFHLKSFFARVLGDSMCT